MSSRLVYRWLVLGGAIWWMPTRLQPRVRWCDCLALFVLAAYARAKPCCLWLVVLACVPTLVLYIWCVPAVLRSGLTAIEMWLLLVKQTRRKLYSKNDNKMARFYDLRCITWKWCVVVWRTDEGGLYERRLQLRSDVSLRSRQLAHWPLQTNYCWRHSQVTWHVALRARWRHAPRRRPVRSTFGVS